MITLAHKDRTGSIRAQSCLSEKRRIAAVEVSFATARKADIAWDHTRGRSCARTCHWPTLGQRQEAARSATFWLACGALGVS